jgi:biopolymer transport protein ExbB/TolQ
MAPAFTKRSDPERAGAPTDAPLAWTGAVALAATALFYLAVVQPLSQTGFGELFVARGRVPYAIAFFAWWAAVILLVKYTRLRSERTALTLDLLPERLGREITPESGAEIIAHLDELPPEVRDGSVARRVRRALLHFASRRDPREVVEQLAARAQADADAVESSYTLVRVFIWAVPILGFIGTVVGIGSAVAGFSDSIGAAADLALMKNAIGSVTTGLGVAFDTTLLALVMSILIMFPASALQKAEEDFLGSIEDYTDAKLVPRLADEQARNRAPEHRVIEEAVARAMAVHHAELRGWLDRLGQIGETLTGQVLSGWQKIDEQVRIRQGEQLEHLGQWAVARQRESSDELADTQRNLLRDFRGHLEGMAAEARRIQEAGAHRHDDQLAGVERLHRRLQEEQATAGESHRVQAQALASAAENLARTLGRIRGEASEVRDEAGRVLGDFAQQLRDAARDAQAFQREVVASGASHAQALDASGERLAATLGRIDDQIAALEAWRREQLAARDELGAMVERLGESLDAAERPASAGDARTRRWRFFTRD